MFAVNSEREREREREFMKSLLIEVGPSVKEISLEDFFSLKILELCFRHAR